MQEGFTIEHRVLIRWIAGRPEMSLIGGIKGAGREHRQIEGFRCIGCGYLESFATDIIS